MGEGKSSGGGSLLSNPNALLAIITIVGGLWLVSHELTSDRPVPRAGEAVPITGDQKMDARLWEDPFKAGDGSNSRGDHEGEIADGLGTLVEQIRRKSAEAQTPEATSESATATAAVRLLPVMISGGQYSEDQESRIRSRYAIVSALGQSDYVPDDAEHLGSVRIPWLSWQQIEQARRADSDLGALWAVAGNGKEQRTRLLGIEPTTDSPTMSLRYEWYRPRTFAAGQMEVKRPAVLVLWLDDSYFEDHPRLRLALLLERLIAADGGSGQKEPLEVSLIGPRRSSTLRAMLPEWKGKPKSALATPRLDARVKEILGHVTLYSATASAMDEVLVSDVPREAEPRAAVGQKLGKAGFKAFHNFSATDGQLARELLHELKLRNVDLAKPSNHLVLISEWDTFYARMLSLTYGAELARRQASDKITRGEFVERYMAPHGEAPKNFHSFVYLRGLDGQTVGGSAGREKDSQGRQRAASLEDISRWKPDTNKAEGQAQFDYLGRLADQVDALQRSLEAEADPTAADKDQIKAIGIVGSDVYDTLLILQALRRRFPAAWFFTTDLDVRFLHPNERDWARNLIVVSSYGLTLHPSLQGPIPPFRDSTQTAQFAATLAALGKPALGGLGPIPPRRFEVGNSVAVDFSADYPEAGAKTDSRLHPRTASENYRAHPGRHAAVSLPGALATIMLLGGICWILQSLRQLTWRGWEFPGRTLAFTEEDIGGPEGARMLWQGIAAMPNDPLAQWFQRDPHLAKLRVTLEERSVEKEGEVNWEREALLADLVSCFVGLFNRLLRQKATGDDLVLQGIPRRPKWKGHSQAVRTRLDHWVDGAIRAAGPQDMETSDGRLKTLACAAAQTARESAHALYRAHRRRWQAFWVGVVVFGAAGYLLARTISADAFHDANGEQFSLVSGTSAWPAVALRAAAIALSGWFCFALWHQTEETFLILTRRYRFATGAEARKKMMTKAGSVTEDEMGHRVSAESAWEKYRKASKLSRRAPIIMGTTALYFITIYAMWKAYGVSTLHPTRGELIEDLNTIVAFGSAISFMLLAFMAVDKAVLCRRFIRELGAAPTLYGKTTCRHFARQMGRINDDYLDEWIDLQLIADLTEHVGRLIYYPTILVLLMLLARNSWWDAWGWSGFVLIVFGCNFILALASIVILQRAAKEAKRVAEQSLEAKVKKLKARVAPSVAANDAAREEELLKEVQGLERGAFVPFWENPVVGAIFLSSGGTTILQLFIWFVAR